MAKQEYRTQGPIGWTMTMTAHEGYNLIDIHIDDHEGCEKIKTLWRNTGVRWSKQLLSLGR